MLLGQLWVHGEKTGIEFSLNDIQDNFACGDFLGATQTDPPEKGDHNHSFYIADSLTGSVQFFYEQFTEAAAHAKKLADLVDTPAYFNLAKAKQEEVDQKLFDEKNAEEENGNGYQAMLKLQGYLEFAARMYGEDCYTEAPVLLEVWNG